MLTKDRDLLGRQVLTHYRIDSWLARGGSGVVFAGRDGRSGAPVAIKVVRSGMGDESRARRFAREQRAAGALTHPHIVRLLDSGVDLGGLPVLVWERLTGETLQTRLDRPPPLTVAATLTLVRPVMQALSFAHGQGVVHRDVKPANLYLHREGDRICPKLLDFGIAQLDDASRMTQPGAVVGTLPYVAPERLLHGHAGAQGDVWSVGVMLYRCLSGRLPHGGGTQPWSPDALAQRIVSDVPPPLVDVAPGLPKRLAAAVDRALMLRTERRYATMDDFLDALDGVSAGGALRGGNLGSSGPPGVGRLGGPDGLAGTDTEETAAISFPAQKTQNED